MYGIYEYGGMMADERRLEAYRAAIRARVTPASVVLDLGAGPGIMTLFACQAGARKVYAVEPSAVIQVAREVVAVNGYADRVECIQAWSTRIDLPEKVDVIVSDIRGVLPLHRDSLRTIIDARDRFLKPGGCLIPEKDVVWAAIVTAPELYARMAGPWKNSGGLDLSAGRQRAVNTETKCQSAADALLAEPQIWAELDYMSLTQLGVKNEVAWRMARAAEGHGLCLWFDTEAAPRCGFSNAPGDREANTYGQAFFPWTEPCALEPGDQVDAEIRADPVGEDYVWSWKTEVRRPGVSDPLAQFDQSLFRGTPLSSDWRRKSGSSFVPSPTRDAEIDRAILDELFTGATLEAISREVATRHPDRFPDWRAALTRVGELSLKYSR